MTRADGVGTFCYFLSGLSVAGFQQVADAGLSVRSIATLDRGASIFDLHVMR